MIPRVKHVENANEKISYFLSCESEFVFKIWCILNLGIDIFCLM